jgi:hypothetical protein
MPIEPPPNILGLWSRVNALVEWPDTDEDKMRELATAWGEAAGHAERLRQADVGPLGPNWTDPAGDAFRIEMFYLFSSIQGVSQQMGEYQATTAPFADSVTKAKQGIVDVIMNNLSAYALTLQLDPEIYAAAQQRFVTEIANWIHQHLAALAGQGPTPPPFEPPALPREPSVLARVGDAAGLVSSLAGIAAFVPPATAVAVPLALLGGTVALGAHTLDAMINGPTPTTIPTLVSDGLGFGFGVRTAMAAGDLATYLRWSEPAPAFMHAAGAMTDSPVRQVTGAVGLQSGLVAATSMPSAMMLADPNNEAAQDLRPEAAWSKVGINTLKLLPDSAVGALRIMR